MDINVIKTQVNVAPRKLKGTWVVDLPEVDEELSSLIAKQIQEEVDWDAMVLLLGWYSAYTPKGKYPPDVAYSIKKWAEDHCKGQFKVRGNHWLFEKEQDALWFSLKWSSCL